jgi:hypothetical protein
VVLLVSKPHLCSCTWYELLNCIRRTLTSPDTLASFIRVTASDSKINTPACILSLHPHFLGPLCDLSTMHIILAHLARLVRFSSTNSIIARKPWSPFVRWGLKTSLGPNSPSRFLTWCRFALTHDNCRNKSGSCYNESTNQPSLL